MTAKLDSTRTLYVEQLRDLHSAETQLVEALPKAAKAAHVARLDDILGQMEEGPGRRDAAIIAAAQRIEHYEIAGYGCAATFADLLKDSQAADQLRTTLSEERETNDALTELAEGSINIEAAGGADTESSTDNAGEDRQDKQPRAGTPMRRQSRARSGG
jgi:ferritin-like metal-binding protein YciE